MPGSSIYHGRVRHRRFGSPDHRFSYPVWYLMIDLEELGDLDRGLGFFAHNRFALTSFDDRDHMPYRRSQGESELEEAISLIRFEEDPLLGNVLAEHLVLGFEKLILASKLSFSRPSK